MSDLRPIDCTACPIRHRAVCARCDAAELDQLAAIKTYRNFSAGAHIMQRGAPLEFVASVVTGVVSLSKTLEDGRIQTVGLLLASDFIGRPERVAIDFDVTATTDVVPTLPSLVTSLCSSRIICPESVADIATIIVFTPYSTVTNY